MHIQSQRLQTSPFEAMQTTSSVATKPGGAAAAVTSSSSPSSSTSTATITANDFLQLLVTELQNQDPTADTDPNEYVDQLVQVNSLQQQIQMNQTMDGGPTLTGSSNGLLQELVQINQALGASSSSTGASNVAGSHATLGKTSVVAAGGNLSSASNQKMHAAAETVANALAPKPSEAVGSGQMEALEQFAARLRANPPQK